jgi:hypothetical protein
MTIKDKIKKKFYTVAEANASLPLVRSILRDITDLAVSIQGRHQRLVGLQNAGTIDKAHQEEIQQIVTEFESDQERMKDYEQELKNLNVELKDYVTGLIDFPCWMDGREVYLCWRLGEPEVSHWHELDTGFAGRQKLPRISP